MCSSSACVRTSRFAYPLAIVLITLACLFGWIGLAVPEWLTYTTVNQYQIKLGLWAVCTQSITYFSSGFVCQPRTSTNITPDFLATTQISTALSCGLCTLAFVVALVGACSNRGCFRSLPWFASVLALLACALGIVSAVVFGNNYATFVFNVSGSDASLRWAFWTLIAVALVDFVASVLFALRSLNDCCCVEREYDSMSTRDKLSNDAPLSDNSSSTPSSSERKTSTPKSSTAAAETPISNSISLIPDNSSSPNSYRSQTTTTSSLQSEPFTEVSGGVKQGGRSSHFDEMTMSSYIDESRFHLPNDYDDDRYFDREMIRTHSPYSSHTSSHDDETAEKTWAWQRIRSFRKKS